jgi:hypothetical protein
MSSNGQVVAGLSAVATNAGTIVEVPDLKVPTNRIYNFVTTYRKDYFEDHSLDWCLDEIITRGIAEITRQVKTAKKVAVDKASGSLLKEFNLSPADAKKLLLDMLAKQKQDAEALAAKNAASANGKTAKAS